MNAEGGEAREVDRCGSGDEIGEGSGDASTSGFACAVRPAGEVTDFAFDFGARLAVRGLPVGCGLFSFGLLHAGFVTTDSDRAPSRRGRASFA